ncbi:MAG: pyridoxal-phosphate dependent enzyme, partial [Tannerella sp.]|nr:pyridoxal-phosphate dependent enzyme [Tannerella sp.]
MKYYSTNKKAPMASLKRAVIKGLPGDQGLYMPETIDLLKDFVVGRMKNLSFQDIACVVAEALFGDDVNNAALERIVRGALDFDAPVVHLHDNIYAQELFHGPTLTFKDVGARFMAGLLRYFVEREGVKNIHVLVATSGGDTGAAVADAFAGMKGIRVFLLYPKDRLNTEGGFRFSAMGGNVTALEIDGGINDCRRLVEEAFADEELNEHGKLTSANSVNVACLLPQTFYYFYAYAQLDKLGKADELVISVPGTNLGNLTAGLAAYWMGLPVKRFISANEGGPLFPDSLQGAKEAEVPVNAPRLLDLFSIYPDPYRAIRKRIAGAAYTGAQVGEAIRSAYGRCAYPLDP